MKNKTRCLITLIFLYITAASLSGCADMFPVAVHSVSNLPTTILMTGSAGGGENPRIEQRGIAETKLVKEKLSSVKVIALLDIPNPPCLMFATLSGTVPTTFFDTDQCGVDSMSTNVDEPEQYERFDFSNVTSQQLTTILEGKGYKVIPAVVTRKEEYKLLKNYQSIDIPDVDAFFDLVPMKVGYMWDAWTGRLVDKRVSPYVVMAVRLVAADTKEVIYEDSLQYYYFPNWRWAATILQSPADQNFPELKVLQEQKGMARQRLVKGIHVILNKVAEKFPPINNTQQTQ